MRFGYDGDSNTYGYYGADDSFFPFKSGSGDFAYLHCNGIHTQSSNQCYTSNEDKFVVSKPSTSKGQITIQKAGTYRIVASMVSNAVANSSCTIQIADLYNKKSSSFNGTIIDEEYQLEQGDIIILTMNLATNYYQNAMLFIM